MRLHPILTALRKHKAGVVLISLQIALTLAIVCNIGFIIGQHVERIQRPSGLVEDNLFLITQRYIAAPPSDAPDSIAKLDAMQLADLATLRQLPDVQFATPVTSLPLLRNPWGGSVTVSLNEPRNTTSVNTFTGDDQILQTLGLQLIAGRNFTASEIGRSATQGEVQPPVAIVTKALADKLFPQGDALGKPIYINDNQSPSVIVGVVAHMIIADSDAPESIAWNSLLLPIRMDVATTRYAVRARPGRMQEAIDEARKALFQVEPLRVIEQGGRYSLEGIQSFAHIRSVSYAKDIFMTQVLMTICMILLVVTGVGITGLTSFWVSQRNKHIGIRRALGARQLDILRYFQIENLLIVGIGCIVGVGLAISINIGLMHAFELARMPVWYVIIGVLTVLALGQIAAFVPAKRASKVSPLVATRSV
ncbi:ABC transporter permease [Dyella jejuensis]|uniref:ABC transporter permease n=1 Tax=Dyella jejuensis TaxID=1432009 RepID=A0ABW8JLK6_9GAMM